MNLLLDTHALLWWLDGGTQLSSRAAAAIASPSHDVVLSSVVIWECRIKQSLGKLDLPSTFSEALAAQPFRPLPMTAAHAHGVSELEPIHRDPFDRMLVSQARQERLTLVTRDRVLSEYPVATLW